MSISRNLSKHSASLNGPKTVFLQIDQQFWNCCPCSCYETGLRPYSYKSKFSAFLLRTLLSFEKPNTSRAKASLCISKAVTMATEKMGIKIEGNPPESKLSELGVKKWPKWGCSPSKFPWTYDAKETCYLLKGKVKVFPDGCNDFVEFGAGDLVEFPKGMKCTWDVSEAVDKHYNFE